MTDQPPELGRVEAPAEAAGVCALHGEPWVDGEHGGRRRCSYYVPDLGAGEDYGCPQAEPCDMAFGGVWPCVLPLGHDSDHHGGNHG